MGGNFIPLLGGYNKQEHFSRTIPEGDTKAAAKSVVELVLN